MAPGNTCPYGPPDPQHNSTFMNTHMGGSGRPTYVGTGAGDYDN
jgi:hypothetical protein